MTSRGRLGRKNTFSLLEKKLRYSAKWVSTRKLLEIITPSDVVEAFKNTSVTKFPRLSRRSPETTRWIHETASFTNHSRVSAFFVGVSSDSRGLEEDDCYRS